MSNLILPDRRIIKPWNRPRRIQRPCASIANWNPDLNVSPGTSKASLNGYLTTPFAGGLVSPTPPTPPTPPSGMLVWLKSGTQVVSGSTVNWPDSSGNSYAGVGTGTLGLTTIGGKVYVTGFNIGTSSYINVPFNFSSGTGYQVYFACQVNAYTPGNIALSADANTTTNFLGMSVRVGDSGNSNQASHNVGVYGIGGISVASASTIPLSQTVMVSARMAAGATTAYCRQNGNTEQSAAFPYGTAVTTQGTLIGVSAFYTDSFQGIFGELLIYPPTQNPATVEAYFGNAFGITP